jgi:hypothetical protein
MHIKKYKVITKDGKAIGQLFDTIKDALNHVGTSSVQKIEELNLEEDTNDSLIDKRNIILISRKSNEELESSDKTNQSLTYSRPMLTKVFNGMIVLEVGEDKILESSLSVMGRFDSGIQRVWKNDTDKPWEWVLYHKKGKYLTPEEATAKYGDIDSYLGKEGVIVYMPKSKTVLV